MGRKTAFAPASVSARYALAGWSIGFGGEETPGFIYRRGSAWRSGRRGNRNTPVPVTTPVRPPQSLCGYRALQAPGQGAGTTGPSTPTGPIRPTPALTKRRDACSSQAFSFPPLRRRLFFGKTKKSGGRNSWESPGPLAGSNGRIQKSAPTASSVHRSDGDRIPPPPAGRRSAVSLPGQNFAALYR